MEDYADKSFNIKDIQIRPSKSLKKYLGVGLDTKTTFAEYVDKTAKKVALMPNIGGDGTPSLNE